MEIFRGRRWRRTPAERNLRDYGKDYDIVGMVGCRYGRIAEMVVAVGGAEEIQDDEGR